MRLYVLSAPLLLASATFARSHAHLRRGQATDTCATLDVDLVFPDVFIDNKPYDAGHVNIGLCVSQVDRFVGHYDVTEAAIKVVGLDKVKAAITAMIKQYGVECSYPPYAQPIVNGNNECDFVCTDGFSEMPPNNPTSCICMPPQTVCNGTCGSPDLSCDATAPPSRRQHEPKCATGLTMCGVPDATSGEAYKCTDVTSDSYTCGGCIKACPFGSPSTDGTNCHDIPNVDDVSCMSNQCVVHSCKGDFTVSDSKDGCVAKKMTRTLPVKSDGNPATDVDAAPASGRVSRSPLEPSKLVRGFASLTGYSTEPMKGSSS